MDHYVPKRRLPVTLWSPDLPGVAGQLFLDLDASGMRHQTILERLNESTRFVPLAIGREGRIHLYNRELLTRVTPGPQVIQSDVFARGFTPWREERAAVLLSDGTRLSGKVWTPLQRASQRLSDFMNQQASSFFVLATPAGMHLVNSTAVVEMELDEGVGAPLADEAGEDAGAIGPMPPLPPPGQEGAAA